LPIHAQSELFRNREPQAASRRLAAVRAVEAVEEMLPVAFRDAWPVVAHGQRCLTVAREGRNDNVRADGCVLERVLDEIACDLDDSLLVTEREHGIVGL